MRIIHLVTNCPNCYTEIEFDDYDVENGEQDCANCGYTIELTDPSVELREEEW